MQQTPQVQASTVPPGDQRPPLLVPPGDQRPRSLSAGHTVGPIMHNWKLKKALEQVSDDQAGNRTYNTLICYDMTELTSQLTHCDMTKLTIVNLL